MSEGLRKNAAMSTTSIPLEALVLAGDEAARHRLVLWIIVVLALCAA